MRKLLLAVALGLLGTAAAQQHDMLTKKHWLVEANTNFGALSPSNTSIGFMNTKDQTMFRIGGEVGYLILDNLAIKGGLGFTYDKVGDMEPEMFVNYKAGIKYYLANFVPIQFDLSARSNKEVNNYRVGFQGGYAWFLSDYVSLEPGLRYDMSVEGGGEDVFSGNVGFVLHF